MATLGREHGRARDPEMRVQNLVAALEQALQAARCLLVAMEAAGEHPEATTDTPRPSPGTNATGGLTRGARLAGAEMHACVV